MRLIWTDIETTGLDPLRERILEGAIIVTDEFLNIIVGQSWLTPIAEPDSLRMDDFVRDMHTKSGLLQDCYDFHHQLATGQEGSEQRIFNPQNVRKFLADAGATGGIMAGNSVHFDRTLLIFNWGQPVIGELFHHRIIDVSTIKETAKMDAPWVHDEWKDIIAEKGEKPHRAMPDVTASLEEYKFYRSAMQHGAWMPTSFRGPVTAESLTKPRD